MDAILAAALTQWPLRYLGQLYLRSVASASSQPCCAAISGVWNYSEHHDILGVHEIADDLQTLCGLSC
jgi:hypothetical protein